jgi:hypothetical protein
MIVLAACHIPCIKSDVMSILACRCSSNVCPTGSKRAGHFDVTHVYVWQDVWTLFSFLVSGLVDLAASSGWLRRQLPPHMPHSVTAVAFGLQVRTIPHEPGLLHMLKVLACLLACLLRKPTVCELRTCGDCMRTSLLQAPGDSN